MKRIYYKSGRFKDVEDNQSWKYENDPYWEKTENLPNPPLEPLQAIFDILYSPYLEDEEKVVVAISKTKEISTQIKEDLGRFLRRGHIDCSHDMETTKGFVSLLKTFNMYSEPFER